MPELAETLTPEARSALGEVYRLLASIGARENANAAGGTAAEATAEGGRRGPDVEQPST